MKLINYIFGLILFITPVISCASDQIIAGTLSYSNSSSQPIIIEKNTDGSWIMNHQISELPADLTRGMLSSSSCSNNTCIAAGYYQKKTDDLAPLILISQNKGKTWVFVKQINGIPFYVNEVNIFNVHCDNKICMAVGQTKTHAADDKKKDLPLLLISKDNGVSWVYSNGGLVNLFSKTGGRLSSVTHSGTTWITSGYYNYYPFPWVRYYQAQLLMVSQDSGNSWKEINLNGNPIIPPALGILEDLKCSGNLCYIVGENGTNIPLIARSNDNGANWMIIKNISGIPSSVEFADLEKISCANDSCFASGSDFNGSTKPFLFMVSNDKGLSWSQINNIQNLPSDFERGEVKNISCTNNKTCGAIGWWINSRVNPQFFPMLLISQDAGQSWVFQNMSNIINDFSSASFYAINCADDTCMIIGKMKNSPLILTSVDKGESWKSITNIDGLPNHKDCELVTFVN